MEEKVDEDIESKLGVMEHGILGLANASGVQRVEETFRVGQKVMLYIQHACITAAQHHVYHVVDEEDIVRETWVPWKGW